MTSQQNFLIIVAVVAAIAFSALVVAGGLLLARRGLKRRLAKLATRLTDEPLATILAASRAQGVPDFADEDARLDSTLERLERAVEGATEAVALAGEDAVRLRQALDAMPQGVIVCGEDGRVLFRNSQAIALVGSRHADAIAARTVEEMLAASAAGTPGDKTLDLYGPPRRVLTVRTAPIDDGRRHLGVIAVLEDITERRRLEAVRRDFVANVSHELKTPVGALGLLAETLAAERDPTVASRLADRMQTEAFRVSRIIDDLLDLSRIEAEEAPVREPTSVNLVMAEAVERVRPAAEARRVTLILDEPEGPVVVLGDRRQLVSALYNLLDNAIKYSDEGSQVTFSGRVEDGSVLLAVRDHGIGIPARDRERIFERFYRVDQGRSRQTGGTGLGLAIVRHVAHNHAGQVTLESLEGEGSTFTLRLPVTELPAAPGAPGPPPSGTELETGEASAEVGSAFLSP